MALSSARAPCTWIATSTARCAVRLAKELGHGRDLAHRPYAGVVLLGRIVISSPSGLHVHRDRSASWCETAWNPPAAVGRTRAGFLDVRHGRVESRLRHADGERATLGRKRSSVSIATPKAAVALAEHLVGLDANAVEGRGGRSDAVRAALEVLAREPVALARDDRTPVIPFAPPAEVRAKTL